MDPKKAPIKELAHDLLTNKYTMVFHENPENMKFGVPNHFSVYGNKTLQGNGDTFEYMQDIHFQEGPIRECGVNGICNEDAITMVIARLEHFQKGEFACRENAVAITKLEEAMLWLRKRTMAREKRGVEGTHIK